MTALEQLKSILDEEYISEDGDKYRIVLKPGMTDEQIERLAEQLPARQIPDDIKTLLKFASGFEFYALEEITFDGAGQCGFEDLFPYSIQLAGDGYGNFWIVDIDKKGNWGHVFYVCHAPAVIVKHSESLTQFIEHINDSGKHGSVSNLDVIHEKIVFDIHAGDKGWKDIEHARQSDDITLKEFAMSLPDNFVVVDMRNKPVQSGFVWNFKSKTVRHETELIWGIEKPEKKTLWRVCSGYFYPR